MTSTTMSSSTSDLPRPGRSATVRWTTWTRRHPRPALAGWVLLLVVSMAIGSWSELRLASPTHAVGGQAGSAASVTAAAPVEAETGSVVFGGHGRLSAATVAAVRRDLAISMSRVPGVDAVGSPVLSADGSSAVVTVTLTAADAGALRQVVGRLRARHPGLDVSMTGATVADAAAMAA